MNKKSVFLIRNSIFVFELAFLASQANGLAPYGSLFFNAFRKKNTTTLLDGFICTQISHPFYSPSLDHYQDNFYNFGQATPYTDMMKREKIQPVIQKFSIHGTKF